MSITKFVSGISPTNNNENDWQRNSFTVAFQTKDFLFKENDWFLNTGSDSVLK